MNELKPFFTKAIGVILFIAGGIISCWNGGKLLINVVEMLFASINPIIGLVIGLIGFGTGYYYWNGEE